MKRLDPAAWHVISPLFDRALDLDAAARRAFLDELRASNPSAAETLTRLLASHERLLGSSSPDSKSGARASEGMRPSSASSVAAPSCNTSASRSRTGSDLKNSFAKV